MLTLNVPSSVGEEGAFFSSIKHCSLITQLLPFPVLPLVQEETVPGGLEK